MKRSRQFNFRVLRRAVEKLVCYDALNQWRIGNPF
jgi:hypothetical protein